MGCLKKVFVFARFTRSPYLRWRALRARLFYSFANPTPRVHWFLGALINDVKIIKEKS